jgi:NTP pyrophosphatase (non-canonical NTP hydrolase)
MTNNSTEALHILQEECAEVIQAISKINRFGIDNSKPGVEKSNRQHLEEEIGDLLAMVEILAQDLVIDTTELEKAKMAKFEKLKKWSNIKL